MESFEIPSNEEVGDMEPDAAAQALEKIDAEQMGNDEHPLSNPRHPQHERYLDYHTRLWDAKCRDIVVPTVEEGLQEHHDKMMRERISHAKNVMAELGNEGFQVAEIPDDLLEVELEGLKVQLALARHEFSDAAHFLTVSLSHLPSRPKEIEAAMETFQNAGLDDVDGREDAGNTVLHWVVQQEKRLAGVTRGSEESA